MRLHALLTPARLRKMAGTVAFDRGEAIAASGAVRQLAWGPEELTGTVHGSSTFDVRLWVRDDELRFSCTCGFAVHSAVVCKHFVAVGLAALGKKPAKPAVPARPARLAVATVEQDIDELRKYLRQQDAGTLTQWLLNAARCDRQLTRTLLERARDKPFDPTALREAIEDSTDIPYFVHEHAARDVALVMERMLDALLRARKPDTAAELIGLIEYAYDRVERSLDDIDDSGGYVGDILLRLGHLHVETCRIARPDPVRLAERLFHLGTSSELCVWEFDHVAYADVLGETGLRRYRELAEAAWRALPPPTGDYEGNAWVLARIMEKLAENDIELKVAVLARDLSNVNRYRDIVWALRDVGMVAEALDWAERALAAFPNELDQDLCDMLVERRLARGEPEQAATLRLRQFARNPSLDAYQALAAAAQQAGQWHALRTKALAALDKAMAHTNGPDRTVHVAIAMWEGDLAMAWRHAAVGGCAKNLLAELARGLARSGAKETFACYRRLVSDTLTVRADLMRPIYEEAVEYVRTIVALLDAQGRFDESAVYLRYLRTEYERKRSFIKLLDTLP